MSEKPLNWIEARISDRWQRFFAETPLGDYEALEWSDGTFGGSVPADDPDGINIEFRSASIEAAKLRCQEHFNRRVAELLGSSE